MARLLGIDIGPRSIKVAILRTSYRKTFVESLSSAPLDPAEGMRGVQRVLKELLGKSRPDTTSLALGGENCFLRRLELPASAARELESVLLFELESSVPIEIDEAVFDHRRLAVPGDETLVVFAAVARLGAVQELLDQVKSATGREPDVVDAGSLPLANLALLAPEISATKRPDGSERGPVAILDLGERRSELVFLDRGLPAFARTLSRGTDGLPDSAPEIARELRQSIAGWRAVGGAPLSTVYLVGEGAGIAGAMTYLGATLGVEVLGLPKLQVEGLTPDLAERAPGFARAIAVALSGDSKSRSMNLRQGALAAARSFAFIQEKLPLLAGLALVVLVSFGFNVVAELRALSAERTLLEEELKLTTREVFGEETTDLARATELLEKGPAADDDPFPGVDAFDVMIELSKAVPKDVVHDVAELDVARGHAIVQGILPSGTDAQATADTVAMTMKTHPCLRDVKVIKVTQSGPEKQKYILEMDLRCEDKKKKPASGGGDAKKDEKEGEQ
jgi:general secretion pathway protein L